MNQLAVNDVIQWHSTAFSDNSRRVFRVIRIDPGKNICWLFDIEHWEKAFPEPYPLTEIGIAIDRSEIQIVTKDPNRDMLARNEQDLKPAHRERRDKAYATIADLVESHQAELLFPPTRGPLVLAAATEHGTNKKMIFLRIRLFWRGGLVRNALLPDYGNCGGKGRPKPVTAVKRGRPSNLEKATGERQGINVTPEMAEMIRRGYQLFYVQQKRSLYKAYHLTLQKYFNQGFDPGPDGEFIPLLPPAEELISYHQFRDWVKKLTDPVAVQRVRQGDRKFDLKNRDILGDSTSHEFGPGSRFQIDATIADIYLVSSRDRTHIIGRPVMYFILDVFSRMIVAFAVTLEGPSWLGASQALLNMVEPKVDLCARYGITIAQEDWPCEHLPHVVLADRGEILSKAGENAVARLGIGFDYAAAYRADWKGIVERNFRLLNQKFIHWMPGAVYEPFERGGKDYRLDARLTLNEFRKLIIVNIVHHNTEHRMDWYRRDEFMVADHVEPYPVDLWNWGIANRTGLLRSLDVEIARIQLLPHGMGSISERGIHFQRLLYQSNHPQLDRWFVQARNKPRIRIPISYDPRTVDTIYIRLDEGKEIVPCELRDSDQVYAHGDWYEILDEFALSQTDSDRSRTREIQADARLEAQIQAVLENIPEVDTSEMSKRERLAGIRNNRQIERESERREQTSANTRDAEPESEGLWQFNEDDDDAYIPPSKPHSKLMDSLDQEEQDGSE